MGRARRLHAGGLDTTRRGEGLACDIRRSETQVVLTEPAHLPLIDGLDLDGVRVLDVTSDEWPGLVDSGQGQPLPSYDVSADDLMMLIFTSGTSGDPTAVRITQEKVASPGVMLADRFGLEPEDVCYRTTYANYVGKPLTYVMATPEQPADADNPLRISSATRQLSGTSTVRAALRLDGRGLLLVD